MAFHSQLPYRVPWLVCKGDLIRRSIVVLLGIFLVSLAQQTLTGASCSLQPLATATSPHARMPGSDLHYSLQLEFLDAVFGCKRTILVAAPGEEKRKLEIFVPIGADDGDKLIIEEEGQPSEFTGGCRGNLIVHLKVKGHPKLQRIGSTISSCINVPWACLPARKGFTLTVLTVDGPVKVQLPCNLDDDMNIVIENKGVPYADGRGIHHVHIRKGRPIERFLFQTAEVALTAAAVCLITLASNRIRKKSDRDKQPEAKKGSQVCLEASAIHHKSAVKWEQ